MMDSQLHKQAPAACKRGKKASENQMPLTVMWCYTHGASGLGSCCAGLQHPFIIYILGLDVCFE